MDKVLLASIDFNDGLTTYYLDELENLAKSNNLDVICRFTQKLEIPKAGFYLGKGKLDEIKMAINTYDIDLVIFNDELSPVQLRNITDYLDVKVIDRSILILNIFAERAQTNEAKIEVALAQLKYMLPRLTGLSKSLSRQGGGSFNAKGPGEKQIELDRRKIEKRIYKLNEELKQIMVARQNRRNRRTDKTVSLVGYTNAGKSSLLNALVNEFSKEKKTVLEADMLFASLSTSSRQIKLPDNQTFILTDTVGFVSKLPHHLINSFKSTLEEILDSDLIIQVIDVSNPFYLLQMETTKQVLHDLKADNIKMFYVYNKVDLLDTPFFPEEDNSLVLSTKTGFNLHLLVTRIKQEILNDTTTLSLLIPYSQGQLINQLEENEHIIKKEYTNEGISLIATINKINLHKYLPYKKSLN